MEVHHERVWRRLSPRPNNGTRARTATTASRENTQKPQSTAHKNSHCLPAQVLAHVFVAGDLAADLGGEDLLLDPGRVPVREELRTHLQQG